MRRKGISAIVAVLFLVSMLASDLVPVSALIIATVDFDPDTLNLKSGGGWVTCLIELPEGYSVGDIDVSTIMFDYAIPVYPEAPAKIGDYDKDDIPDLMVKFSRADIVSFITDLPYGDEITCGISGEVSGMLFEGVDTIKLHTPYSSIVPWSLEPSSMELHVLPGQSVDIIVTIVNDAHASHAFWRWSMVGFGIFYSTYMSYTFIAPPLIAPGSSWTGPIGTVFVYATTPYGTVCTAPGCILEIRAFDGEPLSYSIPVTVIAG